MGKGLAGASIKVALQGDSSGFDRAAANAQKQVNALTQGITVSNQAAAAFASQLDQLGRVQAFGQLQQSLKANQALLAEAKQRARELAAEYRNTGDSAAKLGAEGSQERVKRLNAEILAQVAALRQQSAALRQSGVDTSKLAAEETRLTTTLKGQEAAWAAETAAMKAAKAQQEAYGTLGVRSLAAIKAEMQAVGAAVKTLRDQGVLRPEAIDAAKAKIRELRAEAGMISPALTAAKAAQEAYGTVGVRSLSAIKAEMQAVAAAVRTLRAQGPVDPRVIDAARAKMAELRAEAGQGSAGLSKFALSAQGATTLLTGLAAGATSAVAALGGFSLLKRIGAEAIDFNSTLEGSKTGIAAIVRTFDEGADGADKYSRSMVVATDIQRSLQIEGLKTTATYKELLKGLQQGIAPAMAQGFNPDQIVKFTSAMTKAAGTIGLPMAQLGQEIRAILDGSIDANARIATSLQLTNKKVKELAAQGILYDYLMDKLAAFEEAGNEVAKQWAGAVSNMSDAVQLALGTGFEDSFKLATKLVLDLTGAIVNIDEKNKTFTFNEKLAAAIKEIDDRIESFLKTITKDDIKKAVEIISQAAKELVNVFLTVVEYGMSAVKVLGPLAPLLVKIAGNMSLIAGPAIAGAAAIAGIIIQAIAFKAGLAALGLTAAGVGLVIGKVALGIGVFAAAYKAGKWLLMGKEMKALEESTESYNKASEKLNKELAKISKETGVLLTSWEDFEEAQKSGLLVYNETTAAWEKGEQKKQEEAKKTAAASEEAAKKQKKKLDELKKEYADLVKEIEKVGNELTKLADEGAADQLKLANASRTPIEAWEAQKQAAIGLGPAMAAAAAEAKKLALAGDIEGANKSYARAVEIGKQMRDGFKELAREVKAEWTPAMEQSFDKAKEKSKEFGEQYKKSFDDAKKAGEDLKKTTEQLADAESGLANAQREAAREGMTSAQVYQDVAAAQKELEAASKAAAAAGKEAAAAGNLEQAQQYYDLAIQKAKEAQQAASGLNQEVKNGEQTVVSAEQARANAHAADISARQLEIEAIKAKQAAEAQAQAEAAALAAQAKAAEDAAKAEAEALAAEKEKIVKTEAEAAQEAAKLEAEARQQITEILKEQQEVLKTLADQKNEEADFTLGDTFTEAGEQAKNLYELNQKIAEQLKIVADESAAGWQRSFAATEAAGLEAAAAVDAALDNAARDRTSTITTYVKEVQQRAAGGFAQRFADGGSPAFRRLSHPYITSGSGLRDDVPALLKRNEFVLTDHAVMDRRLKGDGPALAWAHNRKDYPGMAAIIAKHFAPPLLSFDLPAPPDTSRAASPREEHLLTFVDPALRQTATVSGSPTDLAALEKMMKHRKIVASR